MTDYIPYNQWVHQHDEKIKAEYAGRRTADLADEVERNYYTVSRKAKRLGVQKSEAFMHSSWSKGGRKSPTIKGEEWKRFRAVSDVYLKEHFAGTANEVLAQLFGVDVKTVRRWARRLGLQKSEAFMRQAREKGCAKPGRQSFYTPEHETWRRQRIAAVYPDGSEEELQALAEELGIKRISLHAIAAKYGIYRSEEKVKKAHENIKKATVKRTIFTPELVAKIAAYYPDYSNAECAAHFGVNLRSLKLVASKNKWRKSKEYLHIVRSQARKGNEDK